MTLERLIQQFMEEKNYKPTNQNDLLDYLKRGYIQGKLSFVEYRTLMKELDQQDSTIL